MAIQRRLKLSVCHIEFSLTIAVTLLPDILRFDHTEAAPYTGNGRMLNNDVLDPSWGS